jgi:glycosyltransferase involved in cell wall biosynthesis
MRNKETKKILYVITKSNWGGAQRYVYDMATEVSKKDGYEVSVALGGDGVLIERLDAQHIPVISITSLQRDVHIFNDAKVFFELLRIFQKEQPDVIHLNSSKVGVVGALAARTHNIIRTLSTFDFRLSTRILFTAHGWAHTEDRPQYQKKIIKFLHWFTIILCHTTIAVSEQTRKELADTPCVSKKLTTVYNGVTPPDLLDRTHARATLTHSTSLPHDALLLGTIAELHTNKGLTYAIEACQKIMGNLPNLFFCIIGSGEREMELKKLVAQKDLTKRILFFESSEANRYLSAYDIFILPSVKEGLPYTILEAGCAHLPVIASNIGGIPEILTHRKNGLLTEPRNIDEIALSITDLTTDPHLRETLGEALFTTVKERFSTSTMVEKTILYYN